MQDTTLQLRVECYAGYRGEQTPRRFSLGDHTFDVVSVLDAWLAPDHRYFKVTSDDGDIYILRHDTLKDCWELTLLESSPG